MRLQSEAISGESFILAEMKSDQFSPDPFPFARVGITAWDHPLYIVLGYTLVQAFPSIDPLWLVNLISALSGAAAVTLVFLLGYQFTSSHLAALYAAASLAVSHTFWWHSSTPEVYTLFAFLLLASLYFFLRFERTGNVWALTSSAFLLGLAATDHVLAFLALPALALDFLLFRKLRGIQIPHWRKLVLPIPGFLIGFSLYIVQFVRMTRSFPVSEVMGPVVGSTFLSGLAAFSPMLLLESLLTYLLYLFIQFGPIGILLGVLGIRRVFDPAESFARKILSMYIVYAIFGILYRVTDQFAFFLTSHVFFALLMAIGLSGILAGLQTRPRFILAFGLLLIILATPLFYSALPPLMENNGLNDSTLRIPQIGPGLRDGLAYYIDPNKRGDFNAYNFGKDTITKLAPNSVVIAEWYTDTDEYFVLRYFTEVRGQRPDVTLFGWPTEDPFSFDTQLATDAISTSFPQRPVYLASLSDRFYAASRLVEAYCIVPESNLYRLYPRDGSTHQCLGPDSVSE